MRENLTREERLKRKTDISRVFREGKAVRCSGAHLRFAENELDYNRIAFTCVRKFTTAVERNRAKRLSREIYRKCKGNISPGHDFVLVLYPSEAGYLERKKQVEFLFSETGLVHGDR